MTNARIPLDRAFVKHSRTSLLLPTAAGLVAVWVRMQNEIGKLKARLHYLEGDQDELKREKGRATPDQKLWKEELQRRGYKAVIAMGYSACLDAIKDYFNEDNLSL